MAYRGLWGLSDSYEAYDEVFVEVNDEFKSFICTSAISPSSESPEMDTDFTNWKPKDAFISSLPERITPSGGVEFALTGSGWISSTWDYPTFETGSQYLVQVIPGNNVGFQMDLRAALIDVHLSGDFLNRIGTGTTSTVVNNSVLRIEGPGEAHFPILKINNKLACNAANTQFGVRPKLHIWKMPFGVGGGSGGISSVALNHQDAGVSYITSGIVRIRENIGSNSNFEIPSSTPNNSTISVQFARRFHDSIFRNYFGRSSSPALQTFTKQQLIDASTGATIISVTGYDGTGIWNGLRNATASYKKVNNTTIRFDFEVPGSNVDETDVDAGDINIFTYQGQGNTDFSYLVDIGVNIQSSANGLVILSLYSSNGAIHAQAETSQAKLRALTAQTAGTVINDTNMTKTNAIKIPIVGLTAESQRAVEYVAFCRDSSNNLLAGISSWTNTKYPNPDFDVDQITVTTS